MRKLFFLGFVMMILSFSPIRAKADIICECVNYLDYLTDSKDYSTAVNQKANEIINNIISDNMTDEQKARSIYNYICKTVKYGGVCNNNKKLYTKKGLQPYSAYGALINGIATCNGYEEAFRLLGTKAGLTIERVYSKKMYHTWDRILLNGNWYYIDVTWGDSNRGIDYSYYLVGTKKFKKTHIIPNGEPKCGGKLELIAA